MNSERTVTLVDDSENDFCVRFLVENSSVGSIIGKGGSIVAEIREASSTRIDIAKQDAGIQLGGMMANMQQLGRMVTVTGGFDNVMQAFQMLWTNLKESEANADMLVGGAEEMTLKMLVPNGQAGAIIGKGGANIFSIREASGVNIIVAKPSEMPAGCAYRLVTMRGAPDVCESAMTLVCQKLQEAPLRGGAGVAPAPSFGSGFNGGQQNQGGSFGLPALGVGLGGGFLSQQVSVPDEHIGKVIGKSGSSIGQIRQMTGARLEIAEPDANSAATGQRSITISGTQDQIQAAQYMVNLKVSADSTATSGETTSVQIQVPNDSVGRIIGRGGANLTQMRQLSGARLDVAQKDAAGADATRAVTVTGTPEQVKTGRTLVELKATEVVPALSGGFACALQLPNEVVGRVIGRGGSVIERLRQSTGARFDISPPPPQPEGGQRNSEELRDISITAASADQIRSALDMIGMAMVQGPGGRGMGLPPAGGGGGFGHGAGAIGGGLGMGLGGSGGATPYQLQVPNETVGRIIGRGGSNLMQIRQLSGARLDVAQQDPTGTATTRIITITGTPEQIQNAQYLISVKMAELPNVTA